jgi:hypothetical protein
VEIKGAGCEYPRGPDPFCDPSLVSTAYQTRYTEITEIEGDGARPPPALSEAPAGAPSVRLASERVLWGGVARPGQFGISTVSIKCQQSQCVIAHSPVIAHSSRWSSDSL